MRISVSGNMGSGKTTLLKELEKSGYHCICEPLEDWEHWLEVFYENPSAWTFPFQTKILYDFSKYKNIATAETPWIFERSPLESKMVFGTELSMHDLCQDLYDDLYLKLGWSPEWMIYLRTDPAISYDRIKSRGRSSEKNVEMEYIMHLHERYETFMKNESRKRPVFTVNANLPINTVVSDVLSLLGGMIETPRNF